MKLLGQNRFEMKRALLELLLVIIASVTVTATFAQGGDPPLRVNWYATVKPWREGSLERAMGQSASATTLPLAAYNVTSTRDGNNYSGVIVGRNPLFHGARTTLIPVFIVPLKIVMADSGHAFDPTAVDPFGCLPSGTTALSLSQASPIFQAPPNDWTMNNTDVGAGQYNDVFQRAEFFDNVAITRNRYHTALTVGTLSEQAVEVPVGVGRTIDAQQFGGCGALAEVDVNSLDSYLTGTLIPALAGQGVGPTNFPFFLLYNVVMTDDGNCCILGYHGATGSPLQTYSPTDFDSTGLFTGVGNTSVFAHEVGEWLNDPTGNNPTPAWGHTGQVSGCQSNFEVGDPLSGTDFPPVTMPNGFTYRLQELAFFSWFYGAPSIGAGEKFSDNGTFSQDAGAPCT
jgi:hypothetical protein